MGRKKNVSKIKHEEWNREGEIKTKGRRGSPHTILFTPVSFSRSGKGKIKRGEWRVTCHGDGSSISRRENNKQRDLKWSRVCELHADAAPDPLVWVC